jgi:hypothetical protein
MEKSVLLEKINEYFDYLNQHKANVTKAWDAMKKDISSIPFLSAWNIVDEMGWRINCHDNSKYNEDEFIPYRQHFYPAPGEEPNDAEFQRACDMHVHRNAHHWQYWVNQDGSFNEAYDVVDKICGYLEMICDWQAMGYVKGDNALEYYNSHKDTIIIDPNWVAFVEEVLQLVCSYSVE